MKRSIALFAGLCLIAAAIYYGSFNLAPIPPVVDDDPIGPYSVAPFPSGTGAWLLDTAGGDLYVCTPESCEHVRSASP
jgi:hypothetical protein